MKHFISTTILLITTLSNNLTAQQISSETYNKDYIHEDFNQVGEIFKVVTTNNNYFILDKGDYLLSRNNNESEYAIIANNSTVSDFVLKTAVRVGPSDNKKASIGIILKAQQDGKGAIIFEINKQGEYRIKQLVGNKYQTLSGHIKQEGWVKSKLVNGIDEHNFIEIRSENNIYEVYTNSEYLTTFFVPDFTSGSCGIIITPETKARISYYYINIKGENDIVANYTNATTESVNTSIENLNKQIKLLEEKNAKLNELNTNTKGIQAEEISKLNSKNTNLATITVEQEEEIKTLTSSLADFKKTSITATAKKQQLNEKVSGLQQQITLEKSINSELSKNIDALSKSSNSTITQLKTKIKAFEVKIRALTKTKNTLASDLSSLKSAHQETASGLSKSIINKESEIKKLTTKLNKSNNELATLKKTQEKHNDITANLNNKAKLLTAQLKIENDKNVALQITNDELKELFIRKDFEINGMKTSEIVKKTAKIVKKTAKKPPTPKIVKSKKTFYTTQLGVFMKEQENASIRSLDSFWYTTTDNGTYVYYSGEFNSPQEATAYKNKVAVLGYPDAFVTTLTK